MSNRNKNVTDIILDEGFNNDFGFESRLYEAGLLEEFQNYLGKKKLIYTHIF